MSSRPSEPVLAWLRSTLQEKNMNVAALANAVGEKRAVVKKVLAGKEPLTVDQLMKWTQALDLKAEDLVGVPTEVPAEEPGLRPASAVAPAEADDLRLDPYGLHGEQAIRMAFALGVDFGFLAETEQLQDSGLPAMLLERFPERIMIRLDAAYHVHQGAEYDQQGISLTLSFDGLYRCTFPWSSIVQVIFYVEPPEPMDPEELEEEEDEPAPAGRPTLRLVT